MFIVQITNQYKPIESTHDMHQQGHDEYLKLVTTISFSLGISWMFLDSS